MAFVYACICQQNLPTSGSLYTPIFKTLSNIIHYNSNTYYVVVISAAKFKNIRNNYDIYVLLVQYIYFSEF